MTACPTDEHLLRFLDGALSLDDTERARCHLAECARCREQEAALRALVGDIGATVPSDVDVRAHVRTIMAQLDSPTMPALDARARVGAVMSRIDGPTMPALDARARVGAVISRIDGPTMPALDARARVGAVMSRLDGPTMPATRRVRRWWFAAGGALAASALVLALVGLRGAAPTGGTWTARGGGATATIARDVGVQPYAVDGRLRPLVSGMTIDGTTPLTAGFRNVGRTPAYLLLFAVDERRIVHWISPAYARPGDDPVATALSVTAQERALETTVVLEDVPPGPLRIIAAILPAPAHASVVESLEGTELSASSLVRLLPGAEIRETVVEVRRAGTGE